MREKLTYETKIFASDINQYVPQQRFVGRGKFGTGFVSSKTKSAFLLTEYKGHKIRRDLDAIMPIVETVAKVVSKGLNFYKRIAGN